MGRISGHDKPDWERVSQDDVSIYIADIYLNSLKHNYKIHLGRNEETDRQLLLDKIKLAGISGCDRVPNH
jgi:hypothetical protein